MMRGVVIAVLFGVLPVHVAHADTASLARARAAYTALEYDQVLPLLDAALKETTEPTVLREIYELKATVHVMYGDSDSAQKAFEAVLRLQPDYVLPEKSSPTVRTAFDAAKKNVGPSPTDTTSEYDATTAPAYLQPDPDSGVQVSKRDRSRRFYREWWFWTAVVAGAAGVGAGSWAIWRASQPEQPRTDFGPFAFGP